MGVLTVTFVPLLSGLGGLMTIAKVGNEKRMEKIRSWSIFWLWLRAASAYCKNGIVCNRRFCLTYCIKCMI